MHLGGAALGASQRKQFLDGAGGEVHAGFGDERNDDVARAFEIGPGCRVAVEPGALERVGVGFVAGLARLDVGLDVLHEIGGDGGEIRLVDQVFGEVVVEFGVDRLRAGLVENDGGASVLVLDHVGRLGVERHVVGQALGLGGRLDFGFVLRIHERPSRIDERRYSKARGGSLSGGEKVVSGC